MDRPDLTVVWSGTLDRAGLCPPLLPERQQHPVWYAPSTRSDGGLVDRRHYRMRSARLTEAQTDRVVQARAAHRRIPWRFAGTRKADTDWGWDV